MAASFLRLAQLVLRLQRGGDSGIGLQLHRISGAGLGRLLAQCFEILLHHRHGALVDKLGDHAVHERAEHRDVEGPARDPGLTASIRNHREKRAAAVSVVGIGCLNDRGQQLHLTLPERRQRRLVHDHVYLARRGIELRLEIHDEPRAREARLHVEVVTARVVRIFRPEGATGGGVFPHFLVGPLEVSARRPLNARGRLGPVKCLDRFVVQVGLGLGGFRCDERRGLRPERGSHREEQREQGDDSFHEDGAVRSPTCTPGHRWTFTHGTQNFLVRVRM